MLETKTEIKTKETSDATGGSSKKRGIKPKNRTVLETSGKSNTDSIIKVCPVRKKEFEYDPKIHKYMVGKEWQFVCSWECFIKHCKIRMNDPEYISWRDKYFKKSKKGNKQVKQEEEE